MRIENGHAAQTKQSPACAAVTGYTPEAFAADPHLWFNIIEPEDRERVQERVQRILEGKDIPPLEHRIRRQDGAMRWVCDTTILIKDGAGQLRSYDGVIKDITDRKQAEEALRRSETRLHLALEAGRLGDWQWNIVTGELVWSARCKALYGLAPDADVNYERFLDTVHSDDRKRIHAALKRAVETRTDYEEEKRVVWSDGSVHWHVARGRVFLRCLWPAFAYNGCNDGHHRPQASGGGFAAIGT